MNGTTCEIFLVCGYVIWVKYHRNSCQSTLSLSSSEQLFWWFRFEKRRVQDELEALHSKLSRLQSHHEGAPGIERLQEEIKEYKAILKCSVCHDRPKEVSMPFSLTDKTNGLNVILDYFLCF